jgi:neutral trehalase
MDGHELTNEDLVEQCQKILVSNDFVTHTVPSNKLYPHQWLWDSAFIAIGIAHYNPKRAAEELTNLFKGQWHNGMLPNIIFDSSPEYAADRTAWRSWVSRNSPDSVATSGITQPPVIAEALQRVGSKMSKPDRLKLYRKLVPKLIKYHEWIYAERDPHDTGLAILINPYETGMDNTPPWMDQLREHSRPMWIAFIENLKMDKFINVARRDTRRLSPSQRMTNIDALMLWDAVTRLRKKRYDINRILHRQLFAIEDIGFNSILLRNNSILEEIAQEARIKINENTIANFRKTEEAIEELWDETYAVYLSRDFVTGKKMRSPTVASLLPIYSRKIDNSRLEKLVRVLTNDHSFWLRYPIPSVPRNFRTFDQERYWQGPTWINTNWLIIDGLFSSGHEEIAMKLVEKTIKLAKESGIWEYYNPHTGKGLGSKDFSWSAALILDLIKRYQTS